MANSHKETLHIAGIPFEVEVHGENGAKAMAILKEGLLMQEDLMIYRTAQAKNDNNIDANQLYDNFLEQYKKADEIPIEKKLDDHDENTADHADKQE